MNYIKTFFEFIIMVITFILILLYVLFDEIFQKIKNFTRKRKKYE